MDETTPAQAPQGLTSAQAEELLSQGLGAGTGVQPGKSEKEIADILKIHPYRVKLALSNSRNYKAETLLNYLNILSDIDFKIKSGLINKDVAFYMFLLKK